MEDRVKPRLIDFDTEALNTHYCISTDLRDEQMRAALPRIKERLEPGAIKEGRCAVACFGPSLEHTWQQLIDHKVIYSCSGATKFLVDRGKMPTYHVVVDPRSVQAKFVTPAHPEIEYLIASCCHPAVFDALEGQNVRLWHVFDGKPMEQVPVNYPRGEWVLTGGANVGLRALVLAYFMGWRNIDLFGMDYSFKGDGRQHADKHPQEGAPNCVVEVGGRRYLTSGAMVTYCRQFFHEIEQLPELQLSVFGLGLLQHKIAEKLKAGWNKKPGQKLVGLMAPKTISDGYIDVMRKMHSEHPGFGGGGARYAQIVSNLMRSIDSASILDYGCGKGALARSLSFPIWEYDPAIAGKDAAPKPAELVVCTDVLEHVEPEMLENVLADIARCTKKVAYFVISTGPAHKLLPDGRNSHLTQKGREWWDGKLSSHFKIGKILEDGPALHIVAGPA